jgi:circadian clock protein KaiC
MSAAIQPAGITKLPTGIEGFDDVTNGGLPQGSATLIMGGPGCGKTVFALQVLVNAAATAESPGIFVAFEENALRVSANANSFGWEVTSKSRIDFVDAKVRADVVKSGAFDLTALLSVLDDKIRAAGARIIVFDAIDVLLNLLNDPLAEYRELYRLNDWIVERGITALITMKAVGEENTPPKPYGFIPFMADCAVLLAQKVSERMAVRSLRVLKYRGSAHVLNEVPFVIGPFGFEVGSSNGAHPEPQPFNDRVSLGGERLDAMLGGGVYRGTNALVTGSSGAGKTMLAGAFIDAACRRNEKALFISFDENARDIVRDLATIGIDLSSHLGTGLLRMESLRSESASSEEHFMRIKRMLAEHQPRCLAVDPLSALARVGGGLAARSVAERLIHYCRNAGITVLFTSLLEGRDPTLETTTLHVSTISDSWIQISYALLDGERKRALSIIKSRGSKHSSRLREFTFGKTGITIATP